MKMQKIADILISLSVVTAIVSGMVSLFQLNWYLAGTQWMLVAIALGIYGLFIKLGKRK